MGYVSQDQTSRNRYGVVGKTPLTLVGGFIFCEYISVFVPDSVRDEIYNAVYFLFEDLSTVFLAAAFYSSLSYTSMVLKGVSFSTVVVAISILLSNILNDVGLIPASSAIGISVAFILIMLQTYLIRFIFHLQDGKIGKPDSGTIYLVINKPHNFTGLLGLIWSGVGRGCSAYVDGNCYWFSREKGILIKNHDPDWYRGKRMLDYGEATSEKIADLDSMVGQKWSLWNNCFTVFSAWHRRWS